MENHCAKRRKVKKSDKVMKIGEKGGKKFVFSHLPLTHRMWQHIGMQRFVQIWREGTFSLRCRVQSLTFARPAPCVIGAVERNGSLTPSTEVLYFSINSLVGYELWTICNWLTLCLTWLAVILEKLVNKFHRMKKI